MIKLVSFIRIITLIFFISIFFIAENSSADNANERKTISFSKNESTRKSLSTTKRNSYLVEVSVESLIFAEIAKLEMKEEPYKSCRLVINPPLITEFGLSTEIRRNVFDLTKAEYRAKAAQSNYVIADIANVDKLKQYTICIAQYAELVSNVLQNLKNSYKSVKDLQTHIEQLVTKNKNISGKSSIINTIDSIDFKSCRFVDSVSKIQCKQLLVEISDTPRLLINKQKIFADSFYMNISAKYLTENSAVAEFAKAVEQATQTINDLAVSYNNE